jgi:hypothetical protein
MILYSRELYKKSALRSLPFVFHPLGEFWMLGVGMASFSLQRKR